MKNLINISLVFTALFFFVTKGQAQQDPQYTQYMYNMSVINPGYAVEEGVINFGALYRSQWVGLEGAPQTGTFFMKAPVNDRVQLGLSIVHDEIGDVIKEDNIYADVSYVIPTSGSTKVSFGVKGGVTLFNTDFEGFQFTDPTFDPAFAEDISRAFPNVGMGVYVYGENFYVGLSTPNLLSTKHLENDAGIVTTGNEATHAFLTGGYVFQLSDDFKLKPAFMARGVSGSPVAVDVTANLLMYERIEAGIGYRVGDAVSVLINFGITPQLRVGYAYDYTTSNLGKYNSGSHEIILLYDLNLWGSNKGYDKSPRFF